MSENKFTSYIAETLPESCNPELTKHKQELGIIEAEARDRLNKKEAIANIKASTNDPVNNPSHYTSHPSGIECIQVTEHMNFNLGNAVKYIWRAGYKGDRVQDLEKAKWYIEREISRIKFGDQR